MRKIKDINLAVTVSLTNKRQPIDLRLGWNFATIGHYNFEGQHIEQIYSRVLTSYFSSCTARRIQTNAPSMLTQAGVDLLKMLSVEVRPSPTNFLQHVN